MPHSSPADRDDFDLYDTLNLQRDASAEDVRTAFRELSRIYHPDKLAASSAPGGGGGGESAFMRVHHAYRVLADDALRAFYDRYGLPGIKLAESLSDDEGEAPGGGRQLSRPEDKLASLEGRVRRLLQRREELRAQRLLGLQGSMALACVAAPPGPHGARLRRSWRFQYTATSHSVQVAPCEGLRFTIGCASHVQGSGGAGASKLLLAASSRLGASTTLRAGLNVTGSAAEGDVSMVRSLTPHCIVQQRLAVSGDGPTLTVAVHPWLSRTVRGSITWAIGEEPGFSLGLAGRSSSSGHGAQSQLSLQPGNGELSAQLKCKPCKDFSLKLAPSLGLQGPALQLTCSKSMQDGLGKLHWALRLRRRNLFFRLTLCRGGLKFNFPLDFWPESAGRVPPEELALALAIWALPPLALRLLRAGWLLAGSCLSSLRRDPQGGAGAAAQPPPTTSDVRSAEEVSEAAAEEQRLLIAHDARRRRAEEASVRGLEILSARYGDPGLVEGQGPIGPGVLDVTDCLMAKVRHSRLHVSAAPKSSLLGFCLPQGLEKGPRLCVRYRFGPVEHCRVVGDEESLLLP